MIVCKFGGSCTACPRAIKNIKRIKRQDPRRKIFVFSAIGKETPTDTKMTDLLLSMCNLSPKSQAYEKAKGKVMEKFERLLSLTNVTFDIHAAFEDAEHEFLKNADREFFVSRGEFFTTLIMAKFLDLKFVPAEEVIFFKGDKVDFDKTKCALENLPACHKFAIPGFYGITEEGKIQLFSRGGGDFSGALISRLLHAHIYENWTDVEGIFQINPSIEKSKIIRRLSFTQLQILTGMDAKVIHKDCANLLCGTKAKLKVRSCFSLSKKYTLVSDQPCKNAKFVCYKFLGDEVKIHVQNREQAKVLTASKDDFLQTIKAEHKNLSR